MILIYFSSKKSCLTLIFDAKFEFTIFSRFFILDDEDVQVMKKSISENNYQKATKTIHFTKISIRNLLKCMLIDTNFKIYDFFDSDVISNELV